MQNSFFNWKDYGYDMFIGTAKAPKNPLDKEEMRRQNKYYYELRKAKNKATSKQLADKKNYHSQT